MRKAGQKAADYAIRFDAIRQLTAVIRPEERHRFNLTDIKKDGFIRLDERLYLIQEVYRYEERSKKGKVTWRWYELELFGIEKGDIVYLEFEDDDGLDISITDAVLKMRDINTTMKGVRAIAEEENGEISYNNSRYYYEDDGSAFFIREDEEQPVILYEFESDDEKYITIEAWGEDADEYEIFHSLPIDEHRVEIVSVGS